MKSKLQKLVTGVALAVVTSATPMLAQAQGTKFVDVLVDQKFLQGSCVKMMQGWEANSSIELPADIQAGVKNEGKHRMLVLAKNNDGKYWSVADLAPGESRNFRVSSKTNFAWALFGGHHHCVRSFSLSNGDINTLK